MKSEYRSAKKRRIAAEREERKNSEKNSDDDNFSDVDDEPTIKPPKFYEIKEGEEFVGLNSNRLESTNNSG